MRRALAATIFLTLVLTGCSGTDDDVPDTSPAPSATASDGHGENHDGSDHGTTTTTATTRTPAST